VVEESVFPLDLPGDGEWFHSIQGVVHPRRSATDEAAGVSAHFHQGGHESLPTTPSPVWRQAFRCCSRR
jgi:hypothetical protein